MTETGKQLLSIIGCDVEKTKEADLRPSDRRLLEAADALGEYLMRKYPDVHFELQGVIRRDVATLYDEFFLIADNMTENFSAQVTPTGSGYFIRDSFYGQLKQAEYEKLISDLFNGDFIVHSTINAMLPESCDADMPLEEAMKSDDFFAYSWILLAPGSGAFEKTASEIRAKLEAHHFAGDFAVYQLLPEVDMRQRETAFECIPSNCDPHGSRVYSDIMRFVLR